MAFKEMMEILQEKDKGKIILIKLGAFYIATGKDAVLLHKKLNLKYTCFTNNTCKVGVPIASLDKYIEKLDKEKLAYIVYDYDKEKNELKEKCTKTGKLNKETEHNINCLICRGVEKYKDDKYLEALTKYLSKEKY